LIFDEVTDKNKLTLLFTTHGIYELGQWSIGNIIIIAQSTKLFDNTAWRQFMHESQVSSFIHFKNTQVVQKLLKWLG